MANELEPRITAEMLLEQLRVIPDLPIPDCCAAHVLETLQTAIANARADGHDEQKALDARTRSTDSAVVGEAALICECGHSKTDHRSCEDHDECQKCDGADDPCSDFRAAATPSPTVQSAAEMTVREWVTNLVSAGVTFTQVVEVGKQRQLQPVRREDVERIASPGQAIRGKSSESPATPTAPDQATARRAIGPYDTWLQRQLRLQEALRELFTMPLFTAEGNTRFEFEGHDYIVTEKETSGSKGE